MLRHIISNVNFIIHKNPGGVESKNHDGKRQYPPHRSSRTGTVIPYLALFLRDDTPDNRAAGTFWQSRKNHYLID